MLPRPGVKQISSRHHRLVAECRALAAGKSEHLLLDGLHLVSDAIAADVRLSQVIVARQFLDRPEVRALVDLVTQRGVPIVTASASVMAAVSPVRSPSDVVAIAARPPDDLQGLLARVSSLLVVLADVQDPGNIGAVARVAEAGGADGLLVTGRSADPFGWKALRGSTGSALRLPIAVYKDTCPALEQLRQHRYRLVAMLASGGRPASAVDLRAAVALIVGGEGAGLAPELTARADETITIPMTSPVESLNVAVAAALVIYEARRQRLAGGPSHSPH
jgi:TrmH family RNA methyltransferase